MGSLRSALDARNFKSAEWVSVATFGFLLTTVSLAEFLGSDESHDRD